jgi:hypothetical protein
MRLMAGQCLSGRVEHRLDWFHLRRRFRWLARGIDRAIDYDDPNYDERRSRYRRNLRSVRSNVWHHGKSWHARWMIPLARLCAQLRSHRNEIDAARATLRNSNSPSSAFTNLRAISIRISAR